VPGRGGPEWTYTPDRQKIYREVFLIMHNGYRNGNGALHDPAREPGLRALIELEQFLQEDGWHPQRLENKQILRSYFVGKNGEYRCYAQVRVDLQQFLFYVVAPFRVPPELFAGATEFITRANYGLRIGNFEMDFNDGEVRYKSSLDFEGQRLTEGWLRNAIYPAVQTMDLYLPGLMGVVYGGRSPADAVNEIEQI